jgi:hypothetical protein
VVEGARLESEYAPKAYPGFESLPLRQLFLALVSTGMAWRQNPPQMRHFGRAKGVARPIERPTSGQNRAVSRAGLPAAFATHPLPVYLLPSFFGRMIRM